MLSRDTGLRRVDAQGRGLRLIERSPDGRLLDSTLCPAPAEDGSLVVLEPAHDKLGSGTHRLHVYDARGEPLRSFVVHTLIRSPAYDGRRVALRTREGVLVLHGNTEHDVRIEGSQIDGLSYSSFVRFGPPGADGRRELWTIDARAGEVRVWELP